MKNDAATKIQIYTMSFSRVYPLYIAKVELKGRTKAEVNEVIFWLTGYNKNQLKSQIEKQVDLETFFAEAPVLNPLRNQITGLICGIRVEEIKDPTVRQIRYLDKLIDELARGKAMKNILRQ